MAHSLDPRAQWRAFRELRRALAAERFDLAPYSSNDHGLTIPTDQALRD